MTSQYDEAGNPIYPSVYDPMSIGGGDRPVDTRASQYLPIPVGPDPGGPENQFTAPMGSASDISVPAYWNPNAQPDPLWSRTQGMQTASNQQPQSWTAIASGAPPPPQFGGFTGSPYGDATGYQAPQASDYGPVPPPSGGIPLLSGIADAFRGITDQGFRDNLGNAIREAIEPERTVNAIGNFPADLYGDVTNPQYQQRSTDTGLGTDIGKLLEGIPGIGPYLHRGVDVAASPLSVGAGGAPLLSPAVLAGTTIGGVGARQLAESKGADPLVQELADVGGTLLGGGLAGPLESGAAALNRVGDQSVLDSTAGAGELGRGVREDAFFPRAPISGAADETIGPLSAGFPSEPQIPIQPLKGEPYANIPDGYVRVFRGETPGAPRGGFDVNQNMFTTSAETAGRYGSVYYADIPRDSASQWALGTPEGLPPDMAPANFEEIAAAQHAGTDPGAWPLQGPPMTRGPIAPVSAAPGAITNELRDTRGLLPNLARTNALRAARGLPPLEEAPAAWQQAAPAEPLPAAATDEPVSAIDQLGQKIASEGWTPENRDAFNQMAAETFKNATPDYAQPPPPVEEGSVGQRIGNAIIDKYLQAGGSALSPEEQANVAAAEPFLPEGVTPETEAIERTREAIRGNAAGEPPPGGPPREPAEPVPPDSDTGPIRKVMSTLDEIRRNPVQFANNTARSIETLFDVASPGRLAPTAGLYHPQSYAVAVGKTLKAAAAEDPQGFIRSSFESFNNDPEMADRSISIDKLFNRNLVGMRGAQVDPYSGDVTPGGGIGLLTHIGNVGPVQQVGQRAQVMNMLEQFAKPAFWREDILNGIHSGKIPEDFNLNPEDANYARNLEIAHDYGKAVDLIMGSASVRPLGGATGTLMNFGNWFAAQGELIARGALGGAEGIANMVPGVDIPISPATATARTALGRLAALWGSAAVGLNLAQGVQPNDPRMYKNGVPQVLINPTGGTGPHIPGFKNDTQWDTPIGEFIAHGVGVGRAAFEGATGGSRFGGSAPKNLAEGAGQAIQGAGNELGYWARSQEAWVPRVLHDVISGHTISGETPSVKNEAPLPFFASSAVEDNPRSPGVNIAGMFGGRFSEPSPSGALDNALKANPKYGMNWYDLSPAQKSAAQSDPELASLVKAKDDRTRAAVGTDKSAQMAIGDQRNQDEAAAAKLFDPANPAAYREMLSNISLQTAAKREQADADYMKVATGQAQMPADQNKAALYQYYQAMDSARLPGGKLDGDAFDTKLADLQKAWNPTQKSYVDEQTGTSSHTDPMAKQYYADLQKISDSGYWDAKKQLTQALSQQVGAPKSDTIPQLQAALTKQYAGQYGAQAPLAAQKVADKVQAAEQKTMELWRLAPSHKAVASLIYKWGLGGGLKEQTAAGYTP